MALQPEGMIKQLWAAKLWDQYGKRQQTGALWLALALFFALFAFYIGPDTWLGMVYGDWTNFDFIEEYALPIFGGVIGLFALVLLVAWLVNRRHYGSLQANTRGAHALLAALAAPDDATLPPLPTQTEPLPDDPALLRRQRIRWLREMKATPGIVSPWLYAQQAATFFLLIGVVDVQHVMRDVLYAQAVTPAQRLAASELILHVSDIVLLGCLATFGVIIIALINTLHPALTADQTGLSWRRGFRRVRLPWARVRAIAAFYHPANLSGFSPVTYVIAAGDQLVTWRVNSAWVTQAFDSSLRLLRVASTRTGQPVRDLGPLAADLAERLAAQPGDQPGALTRAAELLASPTVTAGVKRQWRAVAAFGVAVVMVIVAPIMAARYLHDVTQPAYLATLPAQIHAQTPIFTDDLRAPDNVWPVRQATASDYQVFAYTPQGYQLSGSEATHEVFAVTPGVYGAVAIQVTATETGAIPPNTFDGVGIIMRANPTPADPQDPYNYCTFYVNYAGDWAFYCGGWFTSAHGHSAAIHTGPGATNTLLAIARGNQYVGYVNGQYVGQIFDEFGYLGIAGQVGVVNIESGMQATFTDFAVWAVNPPPDLNYV